jgi:hypothetical protein
MDPYVIALFIHICCAIGLYIGTGMGLFSLAALRRAQSVEQVRTILGMSGTTAPLTAISGILIILSGLYMAETSWGFTTPWIDVALVSLLLFGATQGVAIPRLRAVGVLAHTAEGPLSPEIAARIHNPLLAIGFAAQAGVLLGFIFLMTTKPDLISSIIAMAVALVAGIGAGALFSRAPRAGQPATAS